MNVFNNEDTNSISSQDPDKIGIRMPVHVFQSVEGSDRKVLNDRSSIAHQTLGQMADKIQEQARAVAKSKRSDGSSPTHEDIDEDGDDLEDDSAIQGGESTGRWTKDEHALFLEALKRYGKEWKKVASMVKTRTVVQTRTHAQKYFQKLAKSSPDESTSIVDKERKNAFPNAAPPSSSKRARFDEVALRQAPRTVQSLPFSLFQDDSMPNLNVSTFPSIFLPPPPPKPDFPQPSPAACGRRKQMELTAAQVLASGGSHEVDMEGARLLTSMKERSALCGRRMPNLQLSIVDPQGLEKFSSEMSEPGTPWEKAISALAQSQSTDHSLQLPNLDVEPRSLLEELHTFVDQLNECSLSDMLAAVSQKPQGFDLLQSTLNIPRDNKTQRTVLMDVVNRDFDSERQVELYAICKLLLDFGASASVSDNQGNTALHFCASKGYDRVGELLLTKGVPINLLNNAGDGAVHIAAREGHVAFIQMLARLGANFHLRNDSALSALDLAGSSSANPGEREVVRKAMLFSEPRLRTLVLFHQDFLDHTARRPSEWEGPDRLKSIMSRLSNRQEFPDYTLEVSSQFEKADVELLGRVHSAEYLTFVNKLSKQVRLSEENGSTGAAVPFTPQVQQHVMHQATEQLKHEEHCDTSFSSGTLNAARRAAGAVAHAVDRVMLGRNRNAFCAIRPPGHHAGFRGLLDGANSCGFCIFNNIAAGALHALSEHLCERVAIIDLDIHHGNGTEDIVRRYEHPSRLFFFSVHLYDNDPVTTYKFYPGTGSTDDHVHNIINVPILPIWRNSPADTGGIGNEKNHTGAELCGRIAFRQAISQRLIPSLRAFNPDLILISSGFDAAAGDVGNCLHQTGAAIINGMDLLPVDFAWATTEIMKIADICCSGRVISVLEGGYGEYETIGGSTKRRSYSTRSAGSAEIDANAFESHMNRSILADAAAAHVHSLVDPYRKTSFGPCSF